MAHLVVALSGAVSSGKSTLAKRLAARFAASVISTRALLEERVRPGTHMGRQELQRLGDRLDRTTRGFWIAESVSEFATAHQTETLLVVDSIRIMQQIEALRAAFGRH